MPSCDKLSQYGLAFLDKPAWADSGQDDTTVTMVTEKVVPLEEYIKQEKENEFNISWGMHQIVKCLYFLNNDCNLVHGNVCAASVFVDEAGEWKLAGFEATRSHTESPLPKLWESLKKYDPPEYSKSTFSRKPEKWSWDMWGLGCLIWEVYNGCLPQPSSLKIVSKIPKSLVTHYCELVSANPRSRPDPLHFLEDCKADGHFLANHFVKINLQLEELQFMEESKRSSLFTTLNNELDSFPQKFCQHRILPLLINAFEFGGAGTSVLPPLFRLGKLLDENSYQAKIVPCVVKLFSSTDRATRINLLQQLREFAEHLTCGTVEKDIFPNVSTGFLDTVPAMREATIKSMILLAPKLTEKTINNQLLKHFARLQMDEQPGIRTNTTLCLAKIAPSLSENTRQKVLVPAFTRALRDSFVPARIAGVSAIMTTRDYYKPNDVANRLLPAICLLTLDPNRDVRVKTFQAMELFLERLKLLSENPEAAVIQGSQSSVVGAASSWAGWAYSSLTSKLNKNPTTSNPVPNEAQTQANTTKTDEVSPPTEAQDVDSIKDSKVTNNQDYDSKIMQNQTKEESEHDSDVGEWEDDGWSVSPGMESIAQSTEQQTSSSKPKSASSFFDDTGDWGSKDSWSNEWPTLSQQQQQTVSTQHGKTPYVGNSGTGFIRDSSLPSASSFFSKPLGDQPTKASLKVSRKPSANDLTQSSGNLDSRDVGWEPVDTTVTSTATPKCESSQWNDDNWDTIETSGWESGHQVKTTQQAGKQRTQMLREERRLRQQAAKEKRAAEPRQSTAMKLGALKKSD
ncbi:N-terminal kinase-like protein isoform X2 [Corticium candelabrum]|uniref:N-terminal kinase-like protein isoform X2 n=1 Tax=Corticium candelabrum TaxID=121492 RepID=UPI002E25A89D|nr:N-terminal kinase-like protein isoform X2 [Corticium candelabrum]